jgi:uncharacterized protein (TIGR02145 family)
MKTRLLFLFMMAGIVSGTLGQNTIDLTFTAVDSTAYVQLNSIKVMNRSQGGETMIYWPDTTLSLEINLGDWLLCIGYATFSQVGVPEVSHQIPSFEVYQNYPNPMGDRSDLSMDIPRKGKVHIAITDLQGRVVLRTDRQLDGGHHSFMFHPGGGNLYFLTAYWNGMSRSIKMISTGQQDGKICRLDYVGSNTGEAVLKASSEVNDFVVRESGILDAAEGNTIYTFQFAFNIPCPGTPTVTYEGQEYSTIQILSQCWLKENLNVGTMIDGTMEQTDNGILEKYCYNNEPDSCTKYGGLYQWKELVQYGSGAQGICPPGWHVPADEEWKVLEGAADSQYSIGDPEWDNTSFRGLDAGTNLKTISGWFENGTDLLGFSGLPGGSRSSGFSFGGVGGHGRWWTSSDTYGEWAWCRYFRYFVPEAGRLSGPPFEKASGFSVRCLRDEGYISPIELTFIAVNNTSSIELDSIKVMNRNHGEETMIYWPDTTLVLPVDLAFTPGDDLLFIGYADSLQSGILDAPQKSQNYTFQFATNIPCPGTPTVTYEGQVYNTIQIFSQCWLKENLNAGIMIDGSMGQSNNGTFEKYCYLNEPDSCIKYGGLYQWDEMMQYTAQQGVQGICPPDWHLPTDEEWKVLEGSVDSQYGIGDPEWDIFGYNGFDVGTNLKTTSGWFENGNGTDLFGFSGLPSGCRFDTGGFDDVGSYGYRWTSAEYDGTGGWFRHLSCHGPGVGRYEDVKGFGFSVRCLRDEVYFYTIAFTAVNNTSYVELDSIKVMNRNQGEETMIYWPDTTLIVPGNLAFTPGDELLYVGYADSLQSGFLDTPQESQNYTFQFATNIPCPGTPTLTYGGQLYNTIQIFSQCWLKENLNIGTMIDGSMGQSNNGTLEKYCYNNEPANCNLYGGLYQWDEMMQYTTQQGVQGICPPGWHLPTDEEWKVLEGAVDSQYYIGDLEWENTSYRGFDAGTNLRTTSGWFANGTDLFGFSGLPGGTRNYVGWSNFFDMIGFAGYWGTSTEHESSNTWRHALYDGSPEVDRSREYKDDGFSVRCLRDN